MRLHHFITVLLILTITSPAWSQSLFDSDQTVLAQRKKAPKKVTPKKEPVKEEVEEEEGEEAEAPEEEGTATTTLQRGNRMEFDARLIRGETAGAGAVFLFQRAPRALPSMVKTRTSYLSETVQDVLGDTGTEQFEKSKIEVMKEIEKEGKAKSKDGSK